MIRQRKKQVYSLKESGIYGKRQYKFRKVVSEVSSFVIVGNIVPTK